MNKRKFEKKLYISINNNILSNYTLKELIEQDKKSLFNNKNVIDLIKENFQIIIRNCINKAKMIEFLYNYDELKNIINDNLIYIFSLCDNYEISDIISDVNFNFDIKNHINSNFENLLNNCNIQNIYKLYYINKKLDLNEENLLKLNNHISNNKEIFAEIFLTIYLKNNNLDKEDYNSLLTTISMIIDELCDEEKIKYTDILYGGHGGYSNVFLIGNKVLKIGGKRETYEIPNDKRILQPLIRIDLEKYSNIKGTIEVSNKVDTNINLSDEKLYSLYKELRDRKIVFTDLRNANLGYLLKDNNYNWNKELSNIPEARGFTTNEIDNTLKKGEVVIIDTDFIFNEENPNIIYGSNECKDYERRYQEEITNNSKHVK